MTSAHGFPSRAIPETTDMENIGRRRGCVPQRRSSITRARRAQSLVWSADHVR